MPPIDLIQKRIVNISVSSSTVRGQPKGTVKITRNYLGSIDLQSFSEIHDETQFNLLLDKHTESLKEQIPSKSWGISRKVLNIFLFQASHDIILNRKYGLDCIISFLELPLDNPNAKRLVKYAKQVNKRLNWNNIYSLQPETSNLFQDFAKKYAQDNYHCERCYLDVYWWRSEE